MTINLFARFKDLMPADPILVADVVTVIGQRCLVDFPGGSETWVTGTAEAGTRVFLQGGKIIGTAPALDLVVDTI
jgi:hypothetical protein